jgi:circadian clock protein KaiC
MHIRRPFRNVTGILAGSPTHIYPGEVERVWSLFDAETGTGAGS